VFNGEKLLPNLLESVLKQTFSNFELIISDNGSTDKTVEICTSFSKKDKRIKLFQNSENRGPAYNFTKVLSLSSSPYFIWLAHDDEWEQNHLKTLVDRIKVSEDTVLAVNGWYHIDDNGKSMNNPLPSEKIQSSAKRDRFRRYLSAPYFDVGKACFIYGLMRTSALKSLPVDSILGEIDNVGANRPIGRDVLFVLTLLSLGNISYNPELRTWGYRHKGVRKKRSQIKKLFDFLRFPLEALFGRRKMAIERIKMFYHSLGSIINEYYGGDFYLKVLSVITAIKLMALFK
jgi:glycosyltransferase involved in cell wall biosynthesis